MAHGLWRDCLWLLLGCLAGLQPPADAAAPPPAPGADSMVQDLIRSLGSEDYRQRENAERALRAYQAPPPGLLAARRDGDLEVARRATRIVAAIALRDAGRSARRLSAVARNNDIGLLADIVSTWPDTMDDAHCWQHVLDVVGRVIPAADAVPDWRKHVKCLGYMSAFPDYLAAKKPIRFRPGSTYLCTPVLARRSAISHTAPYSNLDGSLIVTSRSGLIHWMISSAYVSGGSFTGDHVQLCVVICEGSVEIRSPVQNSIVIAGGDVKLPAADWSLVLAGGDIIAREGLTKSVLPAKGKVTRPHPNHIDASTIDENCPDAVALVNFFSLGRLGVRVSPDLSADSVACDKPFAAAGLQRGDRFVAVGQREVTSPESLRLLLRAAIAKDGEAGVVVRREGALRYLTLRMY